MIGTEIIFITDNATKLTGIIVDKVAAIKEIEKFSHTTYVKGFGENVYETLRYQIDKYLVKCENSVHTIEPDSILEILNK